MLSFAQITAILAFTGAVAAKPFPQDTEMVTSDGADIKAGFTFSLEQSRGSSRLKNGPQQMVNVMLRYNMEVPQLLLDAAKKQASKVSSLKARGLTGVVPTSPDNEFDSVELSPLVIGGKTLRVEIGLSNSDFWVFSSLQPKDQLDGHNYYTVNPAHRKQNYNFFQGFDGGSEPVRGLVYTEKIKLGAISTDQVFAAATNVSEGWLDIQDSDGLIGLGSKASNSIRPDRQNTFFDNIRSQLACPLFCTALRTRAPGRFDFGFIDTSKIDGPITYANVLHDGWGVWGSVADGFSIGTQPQITKRDMNFHLDTATSISYTQPDIVAAYWSRVRGAHFDEDQQGYVYPCNAENLPQITFTVHGARQVITGDAVRFAPIDDDGVWCYAGLQNIGGGVNFSLFGINFIKDKYLVFDTSVPGSRIGFAKMKKH